MTRTVICLLAALFLHFTPLASQEITAGDSGRLVRVTLRERPQVTGILLRPWSRAQPAMFVCRMSPNGCESVNDKAARWIDSAAIREVALRHGTQWRRGTRTGLLVGTAVGVAVALAATRLNAECSDCGGPPRNTWVAIPVSAAAFGILGGAIGVLHPGWRAAGPAPLTIERD